MLFNSYEFILAFLPITVVIYLFFRRTIGYNTAIIWLVLASLFFYSWWNPLYLLLILASMIVNYCIGVRLTQKRHAKLLLTTAIGANLCLLGYFKYANFIIDNINSVSNASFSNTDIILPLAISFFTFQQIAFLVDAYRGETKELNFIKYALFVSFFPQLIAGPIVHHSEMLPQFQKSTLRYTFSENIGVGIAVFAIGLLKKVGIADQIATLSSPVFDAAYSGYDPSLFEAWIAALGYTAQLYFDFSGYADMALGCALMFGIRLPLNFNSPYKAKSVIQFWQRWHMTLSRFLKDYLYIPLGGNRKGPTRRYANLMITMLLGGLWHGAGWTFILWGFLHGLYLCINHFWLGLIRRSKRLCKLTSSRLYASLSWSLTFLCIVFAWVLFRAEDIDSAMRLFKGMIGSNGIVFPEKYVSRWGDLATQFMDHGVVFRQSYFESSGQIINIFGALLITFLLPNTQTIMGKFKPTINEITETSIISFSFSFLWLIYIYLISMYSILHLGAVSEFLYFQF